ncbi:hypothetical protein Btru_014316 [Bulinus truncatus]|nr:hypothetical protein Btru_014316 [Bulinus truncatus]
MDSDVQPCQTGPKVHEIFSNSALGKNNAFVFRNQEQKQQIQLSSKKKNNAGQVQGMKKFGGYKPKILAGNNDFLAIQNEAQDVSRDLATEYESRTNKTLTKPKPWIIGDKNVPMVLSNFSNEDDGDEIDVNGNTHVGEVSGDFGHYYDDHIRDIEKSMKTHSIHSDTSTLISHSSDHEQGMDNPAASLMSSMDTLHTLASDSHNEASDEPARVNGFHGYDSTDSDSPGHKVSGDPFIPAPDYDEEERTLDFASEDTDDPDSPGDSQRNPKIRPLSKVYHGEDLSHYLTDEDEDRVELRQKSNKSTLSRKSSSETAKPKLAQKHSMFKQNPQGKNKRHSTGTNPGFSSVRNFSYADSKYGTKGRSKSKNSPFTELTDDADVFLTANAHESSYESFLRSRSGEAYPIPDCNDSGVDTGDDGSFTQQRGKNDTIWKKMTLRFKNKLNKVH